MQVSVRTLYGLRALTEMGLNTGAEPIHARDIASTLDMSKDYLNQILGMLKKEGIVVSKKGPHGGYRLARPPESITLAEIINTLEDPVLIATCTDPEASDCERIEDCTTQSVLAQVALQIESVFESITLQDFCEESRSSVSQSSPVIGSLLEG